MELSAKPRQNSDRPAPTDNEFETQGRQHFQKASLDIWHLYKQSMRACEASYLQGKEDAFEEVLKYLLMVNKNADFRFVPINEFINFIRTKYGKHRGDCEPSGNQARQQRRSASEVPPRLPQYPTQEIESAIKVLQE